MRKFLFIACLIVPILSCAQSGGTPIFSINNGIISSNSQFIDDFWDSQWANSLTYTASNPISVQVENVVYTVKTAKFTGWEADPAYNVIEISRNNQVVFVRKQEDAFKKLTYLREYADNDYFITVPLSNEATALIFAGWNYASNPEQFLIVVLTESDAKIVYSKSTDIKSITQSGYNFSMIIQSNELEYVVGIGEVGTPITHTIYQQNGVLYFEDIFTTGIVPR